MSSKMRVFTLCVKILGFKVFPTPACSGDGAVSTSDPRILRDRVKVHESFFCWVTVPISSEYKCTCKGWNVERTVQICRTRCFSLDGVNARHDCLLLLVRSRVSRLQRWDISLPSSAEERTSLSREGEWRCRPYC